MKTILYNPIFINPQAYYVFPRLTRWLRPDDSYKEPANYIGQIEVTIIAYGEIGYTEYFEHTNYIDFTNFSNSYVRISLFTRLGSCVLGEWKIGAMESDRPYIEPEVLASLKAVVIVGDKTNQDKDRDTVANLVDASNPFVISNAAFKLNSGFGKYETELSDTKIWTQSKETTSTAFSSSYNGLSGWIIFANTELTNSADMPSFKIQVKGLLEGQELIYRYYDSAGQSNVYSMAKDGEYTLPADIRTAKPLVSNTSGLQVVKNENNIITITQIPSFEGAFVTDGIDDLITSTKTVQEMLGGSNEITVVSMIHQVKDSSNNVSFTNYIRGSANGYFRNIVNNYGKTGIYGYTSSDLRSLSVVNNILGDKNDYTSNGDNRDSIINGNFSVQGYSYNDGNNTGDFSSVAWYWTIIANKVLTTDQINQVIAYFNLDRTLKPDILCNTIKQGITNENHAEFGDKLIDFSGNGRDIQLNNVAWEGESGIIDGALYLDGISDFGKVTGLPIYKDYTVVADRELFNAIGCVLSNDNPGAFIFETSSASAYSFGEPTTSLTIPTDKQIRYQTKYSYNGQNISIGAVKEGTSNMWLGTIRDNDARFRSAAIYSLMTFPYSLSEFLIERQLRKHKLGTLYPDMVEFRPIVKSNVKWNIIEIWQGDKSLYRPAVNDDKTGIYLKKDSTIGIYVKPKDADEVTKIVVNGTEYTNLKINSNGFYYVTLPITKSPQKINITIDEYIRYEDIVQPYPVLLRFKDENGNEVSWGGKFKVGSTITRIGSFNDCNLLKGIYTVSNAKLNGSPLPSTPHVVEKSMVFTCTATWAFDNNEPKVILSPRLLRIPNSSYKILGHIPDISGHGNHGKINNSAYKLNSGVNGYLVDFTTLKDDGIKGIVRTDSKIYLDKSFNYNQGFWLGRTNNPSPAYKVKVSGIPETGMLTYTGGVWLNLVNGINELPARTNTEEEHGFVIQSPNLDWSNLVIEQIGEYEGAYCLDGVDDFVTIPTTVGGKQVLMKVNWNTPNASILYDQRGYNNEFAIYNGTNDSDSNPIPAYQGRNNGQTYIDGILNSNIKASELRAITHNITITNELSSGANKIYPIIGSSKANAYFVNMALYDFMLFDEISTDDKILELNEYVGIEGNTE